MKQIYYTAVALFLSCLHGLYAQTTGTDAGKISETVKDIPFVFQGEVVDIEVYAGDQEGNKLPPGTFTLSDGSKAIGYISAKIQVCQIYKGGETLKHGTVEIVTTSRELVIFPYQDELGNEVLGHGFIKQNHAGNEFLFNHAPGTKLILFCMPRKYSGTSGRYFDNETGLYPVKGNIILYNSWVNDPTDAVAFGFGRMFPSQQEVTDFMSQIEGLDQQAVNACTGNGQGFDEPENTIPAVNYQTRLDNYQAWLDFKQSFTPKKNMEKDINATALELELENPTLSGTSASDKYLEFDIMISASDNSTYFDNCLIRLQYSASVFGTNAVANNNVVITRGPLYNNATYTNPNTDMIDQTSNTLGIPMGTDFTQSS